MVVSADRVREHIIRHLKWDASLKGSHIDVDLVGRTAVLKGSVPSLVAREAALRDAQSIAGVERVENHLTVKYNHIHPNKTDAEIRSDISKMFGCTSIFDATHIKVDVQDGIATLTGTIDAYWKRSRAEDLAESVEGVLEIKNELAVLTPDRAPDSSIKDEIISALERMEVKGLDKLKVNVYNGVVTLTGSVHNWDTAFDVEDTARYTAGVVDVQSELTVD